MQEEGFVRPQVVRITLRLDAQWLRATIDEGAMNKLGESLINSSFRPVPE